VLGQAFFENGMWHTSLYIKGGLICVINHNVLLFG
jgi:hypothetical protein